MIVLKFGGRSLSDAKLITRCVEIASANVARDPVVVAAAMSGTTDSLVELSESAAVGAEDRVFSILNRIRDRHMQALSELVGGSDSTVVEPTGAVQHEVSAVKQLLDQLESLVQGLLLLRECSPRTLDTLLAFGELISTRLVAARAESAGIPYELVDARNLIVTDDEFSSAAPDFPATSAKVREIIRPGAGLLYITQGFIGATPEGATTTIGRGGSDFTAALIGAAVGASEIQIWTDVNGIMTCDPDIVESAKTVGKVSYSEAAELAFFGSNVVHPSTLQPAIDNSIPVLVKNARDPKGRYTAIVATCYETGVRAIAGKRSVSLVNISSSRMLNAYGFMSRFFSIFEEYQTSVDIIATSEISVTVSVESSDNLDRISRALREIGAVKTERDMAIVSLVGHDLWKDSTFVAEVFSVLREIPIRMISLGSSDINLSVVVPNEYFEDAMRSLHQRFFGTS